MIFADFFKTFMKLGLERFGKYYGTYRGFVTSTEDPEERGRIQVRVKRVAGDQLTVWVDPHFHGAGTDRGMFWPPEVGDSVGVKFDNGDPRRPVFYVGGWHGTEDVPSEFAYSNNRPERRGLITRQGHALIFVDEPGAERVRLLWHKPDPGDPSQSDPAVTADRTTGENAFVSMEDDGSVQVVNAAGSIINMDATGEGITIIDQNGNSVIMDSEGVKLISKDGNVAQVDSNGMSVIGKSSVSLTAPTVNVKGGGVFLGDGASLSAVLGEPLLSWLNSHTHGTGVGPSTPPLTPATPSLLSTKVKVA